MIEKKTPRLEKWDLSVIVTKDPNVMASFYQGLGTGEFMFFWNYSSEENYDCVNVKFRVSGKAFGVKGFKDETEITAGPIVRFERDYVDNFETYMPELVIKAISANGDVFYLHDGDESEWMKHVHECSHEDNPALVLSWIGG